jgi:hypothetical protein
MSKTTQGPVLRPALGLFSDASASFAPAGPVRRSFLTHDSDKTAPRIRPRRQIGAGARAIIVTNPALLSTRRIAQPMTRKPRGRTTMKRTTLYATLVGALLVSATAFGISSAVDAPRSLMAPGDFSVGKKAIESDARVALAGCHDLEGRAKDVCKAEARADERIRKADLEARYRGTVAAAADARLARAKAQFDVAKARCSDQHGEGKLSCLRSAREEKAKALAEAKLAST